MVKTVAVESFSLDDYVRLPLVKNHRLQGVRLDLTVKQQKK